ncbi:MAG: hypothetical protein IH888_12740 [Planctomycetes bacterium]|nr:hypothetical protein [Planctomycetota bacterium]
MTDTDRFQRVIRSIDEANGEDPNSEVVDGVAHPKEQLYGMRMQKWVEELDPGAQRREPFDEQAAQLFEPRRVVAAGRYRHILAQLLEQVVCGRLDAGTDPPLGRVKAHVDQS